MTTLELEASKAQLAREILATDSAEVIEGMKKAYRRLTKRAASKEETAQVWPSVGPHTREEMLARIAESEADEAAGAMYTTDEVRRHLEQQIPGLWK